MKKILIIRLSSIGDIVLTSPILRCLKSQGLVELHYLTKRPYRMLLSNNPHIDKIIFFKKIKSTISDLKNEKYDLIIDLHNSIRSFWIKLNLSVPTVTYQKNILARFIFIHFGVLFTKHHVVDGYFGSIKKLGVLNDSKGLEYFLSPDVKVPFNIEQDFICWCIGASYESKKLSLEQVVNVCNNTLKSIVLIGGKGEYEMGQQIVAQTTNSNVFNFCGLLSLDQSSLLIKKSSLVLTNDTGMMHIAAAFKKRIISFWGCTKPDLGFWPYLNNPKPVNLIYMPGNRPCSKHGKYCRITKYGCVKKIKSQLIQKEVEKILRVI